MANSLLRTRKVGSPHASTSCASGKERQSLRTRVSGERMTKRWLCGGLVSSQLKERAEKGEPKGDRLFRLAVFGSLGVRSFSGAHALSRANRLSPRSCAFFASSSRLRG